MTPIAPPVDEERAHAAALARLRQLDDRRALLAIALDHALIAGAITVAAKLAHPLVALAAMVIIAGRQVAFLNLVHAASHAALFSRKRWNERLQLLFAYPILDAVAIYRPPHLAHHREIADLDPDRFAFLHGELRLDRRGPWGRTWVVFVRPLLGHAAWSFLRTTATNLRAHRREALRIAALWGAVAIACVLVGAWRGLLLYWVLPLVWLHPVFLLWGEISDHFAAPSGTRNHTGPFHALLTNGHALYHDVHHRFPFVPFYDEPRAWRLLTDGGDRMEDARGFGDFLRAVYRVVPPASVAGAAADDDRATIAA